MATTSIDAALAGYCCTMRTWLPILAFCLSMSASDAAAAMTLRELVTICRGNAEGFADVIKELERQHGAAAISDRLREQMRRDHHDDALLVCAMYLGGAIDQVVFLLDKNGLLEEARLMCIPASHFENPNSVRDLLTYKLVHMTEKELASRGPNGTAKSWIATTMLKTFPCSPESTAVARPSDSR